MNEDDETGVGTEDPINEGRLLPLPDEIEAIPLPQFSLLLLISLVFVSALTFEGARSFGAYGFVFGSFLVLAVLGQMFGRRDLRNGGLAGAVTLTGTLMLAWSSIGNLGHMDSEYVDEVRYRFDIVDEWLEKYRDEKGAYPNVLSDLPWQQDGWYDMHSGAEFDRRFEYQRTETYYELTYLGSDKTVGGIAHDADLSRSAAERLSTVRVPFLAFLFDCPGSGGLSLVLVLSAIVGLTAAWGLPSKGKTGKVEWATLFALVAGAIIVGHVMATFHVVLSQSSGH